MKGSGSFGAVVAALAAHTACARCGRPTMALNLAGHRQPFRAAAVCTCPQRFSECRHCGAELTEVAQQRTGFCNDGCADAYGPQSADEMASATSSSTTLHGAPDGRRSDAA